MTNILTVSFIGSFCLAKSWLVQSQTFEMHHFVLREADRGLVVAALKRINLFLLQATKVK